MSPVLRIQLLGDFRLTYDQAPVDGIDTPRLQSLLAYLVLHRSAPQSRSHLAFLFWPDSTERQAHTNLRKLLHGLRHALPDADAFLQADTRVLSWKPDAPFSLDVAEFEGAIARADRAEKAGDQSLLQTSLQEAVDLYVGDLLPSSYDDWILPEQERMRQAFFGALERLMLLLEEQRDYGAAIRYAQRLLRHDPLHEATYRRLMRFYALSGDRPAALRTYHTCVTVLHRELAVGPSPATREAYERLVRAELPILPAPAPLAGSAPLVGRDREWAQLQAAWRAASGPRGGPRLALLIGEAGIGRTRLAEELLSWAARQGIATANACCYAAGGRLAYAPVAAWLRARPLPPLDGVWLTEVARLLPELLAGGAGGQKAPPAPGPLAEPWQRQRLFEALARAVLQGSQPLLLVIHNLQWCDRDTLEWLHYLLRFDAWARLLVVGTLRAEDRTGNQPLTALLESLRETEQLTEIELGPLSESETLSLAGHLVEGGVDPTLAEPLLQGSEGNPLFVVEMVRAGLTPGSAAAVPIPPRIQSVIETRLAQLSPPAREVLELAATIGREFRFAVLARASDLDEGTLVAGLDELWQRRIVREQGTDGYDFGHDKIREVAYGTISAARRRLLHRRVAEALEAAHAGNLDPVSGQVAAHYEQAGLSERAAPYYERAAGVARRLYASEEAEKYSRRALALRQAAGGAE